MINRMRRTYSEGDILVANIDFIYTNKFVSKGTIFVVLSSEFLTSYNHRHELLSDQMLITWWVRNDDQAYFTTYVQRTTTLEDV